MTSALFAHHKMLTLIDGRSFFFLCFFPKVNLDDYIFGIIVLGYIFGVMCFTSLMDPNVFFVAHMSVKRGQHFTDGGNLVAKPHNY